MIRYIKSTMLVMAGLCWIVVAVALCIFLYEYLTGGAGLQVFGFFFAVSPMTVLVGLVHFVGFAAGAALCFVIGVGLCAYGVVPAPESERKMGVWRKVRLALLKRRRRAWGREAEPSVRCVSCQAVLAAPVHVCPDCGWTQPQYCDV